MKNKTLLALLLITVWNLNAQTERGNMLISLSGNYTKTNNESGSTTIQLTSTNKNTSLGTSFGLFVTDNIIAGFGVNYLKTNEVRRNTINIDDITHMDIMYITAYMTMPEVYTGYYLKLENKLYLSNILKFNYGFANAQYITNSIVQNGIPLNGYIGYSSAASTNTSQSESGYRYFSVGFSPELNYFVTPRFALSLGLGGIEYSLVNWQKASSNWLVSFHPNYWKAGIKLIF